MIRASLIWMFSKELYALAIHNIKLSREREENQFPTYPVPHVGDKVLARNHFRNVWDPKYDVLYLVVCVIGWQSEWENKNGKFHNVNVQDIKVTCTITVTYLIMEFITVYLMKKFLYVLLSIRHIQNSWKTWIGL